MTARADLKALEGSEKLAHMKSILEKAREEGGGTRCRRTRGAEPKRVVRLKDERPRDRVREGRF